MKSRGAGEYAQALWEAGNSETGKSLTALVHQFVEILRKRHELALLPLIAGELERIARREARRNTLTVHAAREPEQLLLATVKTALKAHKDAPVTVETDETLVGGARARYGDLVFDGTIPALFTHARVTLRELK